MQIVEPYARLMDVPSQERGIELLKKIEWAGRISHRSEDAQSADSWQRFISAVVLGHGDWSIVEHATATVDCYVDRGITHEIVRHRLFAFTQESTRFVNYEKKMAASFVVPLGMDEFQMSGWEKAVEMAERSYQYMISAGAAPQVARSVFPNALASRIIITGNLRNWRHFLLMRTSKESHPQMRQVTIPLLAEFQQRIPLLYEDIEPNGRQADAMKRMR